MFEAQNKWGWWEFLFEKTHTHFIGNLYSHRQICV